MKNFSASLIVLGMLSSVLLYGAEGDGTVTSLAPFGADLKVPAKSALKPLDAKTIAVDCFSADKASQWTVENPPEGSEQKLFTLGEKDGKNAISIQAGDLLPGKSTVRILLPGDGPANGDVWAKNRANYLSFLCKSNKPAQMTFHLLQRGKTSGTFQTGFSVKPGDWQKILLPIQEFDLKSFAKIAGFGFRSVSADKGAEVLISDINVGGIPFSDDSWKNHKFSISLLGSWHFATDTGDQGMNEKWYSDKFDDSAWKIIKSGASWQEQGIEHYGYGWYRQKIFVPKEFEGVPLTITLCQINADDDAWFDGKRIGGWRGEYKYKNWLIRSYVVQPSLIRYGEDNSIAVRIWGGNITFIGDKSGLVKGPLVAELDPYHVMLREPGGEAVAAELFDLSDARYGKPFEIIFPFPAEIAKEQNLSLVYRINDPVDQEITSGKVQLTTGKDGILQAVVGIGKEAAETIFLRSRFKVILLIEDATGQPLYSGIRDLDRLLFLKRDETPLPPLAEKSEETPYGTLRLVDEIDCSTPLLADPHPYMQSGYTHALDHMPPGSAVDVKVNEILGKKARESGFGWFAYRIGRGKLKPRSTYLLRIEYPEDKPRFAPIEVQIGQNFMDVGWKNGTSPESPYDNWPLSGKWQWYDVIVPLDDATTGTAGTGTAPAENGFWVYFMNKLKPNMYYALWSGGPAVARMKLYEIDPEKNALVIKRPEGLPNRVLSFDWERQPDHDPADLVKYAKLMGYNAISPVIIKWAMANYSETLNGYDSMIIDDHCYWSHKNYDSVAKKAESPYPGKKSQHLRYLEATKKMGMNYIPRFEWGGSADLPQEAWAVDVNGQPAKPNRFAKWCGNLLNPLTWDDLKNLMDHMIKPYVNDNPQLTGVLWRIRCDRMPISYGKADLALFSQETGTKLPPGGDAQKAAWATGEGKAQYDAWWHQKRAQFHGKLVELLRSYRPDLELYYYNWDGDKFGLIQPTTTAWAFNKNLMNRGPGGAKGVYEKDETERRKLTAADYIEVMRTGNFGNASGGINRADYGIRPSLYKDIKGIQIFAPANFLCYADKPEYLNYFQTADGLAVSNVVPYDEIGSRSINPKYEGNMITPAGPAFSMALELLAYFHGDARTINYTVYTYGRGFADAHRRFAQAFLSLPAIQADEVKNENPDVKIRKYPSKNGTYVGVAYKGYKPAKLAVSIPGEWKGSETVTDLVTGKTIKIQIKDSAISFELDATPMQLDAFLIK